MAGGGGGRPGWLHRLLRRAVDPAEIAERERAELASSLHQDVLPTLAAALATRDEQARGEMIEAASSSLRELMGERREATLEALGLRAALREWVARLPSAVAPRPLIALRQRGRPELRVEIALLRIVQAAVTNALQHARAREVVVSGLVDAEGAEIVIADDGVGIGAEALGRVAPSHLGLAEMRTRASGIGAELSIRPSDDGGTEVLVAWGRRPSGPGFPFWLASVVGLALVLPLAALAISAPPAPPSRGLGVAATSSLSSPTAPAPLPLTSDEPVGSAASSTPVLAPSLPASVERSAPPPPSASPSPSASASRSPLPDRSPRPTPTPEPLPPSVIAEDAPAPAFRAADYPLASWPPFYSGTESDAFQPVSTKVLIRSWFLPDCWRLDPPTPECGVRLLKNPEHFIVRCWGVEPDGGRGASCATASGDSPPGILLPPGTYDLVPTRLPTAGAGVTLPKARRVTLKDGDQRLFDFVARGPVERIEPTPSPVPTPRPSRAAPSPTPAASGLTPHPDNDPAQVWVWGVRNADLAAAPIFERSYPNWPRPGVSAGTGIRWRLLAGPTPLGGDEVGVEGVNLVVYGANYTGPVSVYSGGSGGAYAELPPGIYTVQPPKLLYFASWPGLRTVRVIPGKYTEVVFHYETGL